MPVREECARTKANRPSRPVWYRRKASPPRQVRHNQLQGLRSRVSPLRGGSSTARRPSLALAESTSSFCLHPVLDVDHPVGCEPSLDERKDLNIACENYVKLRGVDWLPPGTVGPVARGDLDSLQSSTPE